MSTEVELQAGPGLDRMVAEACGLPYEYDEHDRRDYDTNICPRCGRWIPVNDEDEACQPFHPSTDWNDAMLAAERVGLTVNGFLLRQYGSTDWSIQWFNWEHEIAGCIQTCSTRLPSAVRS